MMDTISILQLPVIGYADKLKALKPEIQTRTRTALDMDCTEETRAEVKKLRAELTKEFNEYETARKAVKAAISKPYDEFNAVYKECISDVFKDADERLKGKISSVENDLKAQKAMAVRAWASEQRIALNLGWLDVDRIMPSVTLTASEKSLREKVGKELERIAEESRAITDPEVFAEYQKCLGLAAAQINVRVRREEIEKAKAYREEQRERERRQQEAEDKIDALAPPTEEFKEDEICRLTFTVEGTIEQLVALKAFIIEQNLKIVEE